MLSVLTPTRKFFLHPATAITFTFLAVAALLRILYLHHWCPYDLAPDEAHYWDWSRHLDWSYYSKGPLVAWLIRTSCWLFGDTMQAVRLPAVLCGSLALWGIYRLTVLGSGLPWLGLAAVVTVSLMPIVAVGSLLMTIDAPYLCCWSWGSVWAFRAVFEGRMGAWLCLGIVIALGFLAKFNMIVLPASLVLFLMASSRHRMLLLSRRFWAMCLLALLGGIPILIWNVQHDWVTVRHLLGQAGVQSTASWRMWGMGEYLGGQAAVLLGGGFLLWIAVMCQTAVGLLRSRIDRNGVRAFLWWMSAPMFALFLVFSVRTKIQLNWPIAAYVASVPLMAQWIWTIWQSLSSSWKRAGGFLAAGAFGLCLVLTGLLHDTGIVYPALRSLTAESPVNMRRLDPTCRLRGWSDLAERVQRIREELRVTGLEPVLAGTYWNIPGELAFYLPDQPTVYCVGRAGGARWSQYDLWRPNPLTDSEQFYGRTFVIVGYMTPAMQRAFENVEVQMVEHQLRGVVIATWPICIGTNFRGFGPLSDTSH